MAHCLTTSRSLLKLHSLKEIFLSKINNPLIPLNFSSQHLEFSESIHSFAYLSLPMNASIDLALLSTARYPVLKCRTHPIYSCWVIKYINEWISKATQLVRGKGRTQTELCGPGGYAVSCCAALDWLWQMPGGSNSVMNVKPLWKLLSAWKKLRIIIIIITQVTAYSSVKWG